MAQVMSKVNKKGETVYRIIATDGRKRRIERTWAPSKGDRDPWAAAYRLEEDLKAGKIKTRAEEKEAEATAAKVLTLKKYGDQCFLPGIRVTAKETTIDEYKRILEKHVYPVLGDIKLTQVTAVQINHLLTDYQKNHAYSTSLKLHAVLLSFFKAAATDGTITRHQNPMIDVLRPRRPKDEIVKEAAPMLTPEQVKQFRKALDREALEAQNALDESRRLAATGSTVRIREKAEASVTAREGKLRDAKMWRLLFNMLLFSGIRRGECCALRWEDIDFDENTFTIQRELEWTKSKGVFITTPKSGITRGIPLAAALVEMLKEQKKQQKAAGIATPWVFNADGSADHLFPTAPTKYLSRFCERNNLPHAWPHLMRHTFSSITYAQTGDIVALSKVLGHSNPAITFKIYSHTTEESKKKAVDAFSKAVGE